MKPTSALYRRLLANREHVRETMVRVGGTEYRQDRIFACSVTGDLIPEAAIGYCIAHELDLVIEAKEAVSRMAQIHTFSRLVLGTEVSEWIPTGVYYIDTRDMDEGTGLLTLHGFDGILKAEAVWWDPSQDAGEWPMSAQAAVADIVRCMGVELDPRTRIAPTPLIEYPNDLTMREVLGEIAAANVGNWSMTGDGKLLLTPLGGLPAETNFLVDSEDGGAILFGSVRIIV